MTVLDAPAGTPCVILAGDASARVRGRLAEFRHRGITLVERPSAVAALLELSKQPDGILLVPSDVEQLRLADVIDLAAAISSAPVILGLKANVPAELIAEAFDHGARGTASLPVTPTTLGSVVHEVAPRTDTLTELHVGALHLVPGRYSATWNGVDIDLTPREFEVLVALMRSHPRALSLGDLINAAGITGSDRENSLRVVVNRVRMHLSHACPDQPSPVETVRGVGYRLAAS